MTNWFPTKHFRQLRKADEGQVLVVVALGLVLLLLAAGFAVDVGYAFYQKHQMQKAADAGAVGAGMALSIYGSTDGQSQITTAGRNDSAANGFTNNVNGITVVVKNPPVDGPYSTVSNNQDYVEVTVSQLQPTFFMKVGGFFSVPVSARAVAGLRGGSGCIYVLDPSDSDSYLESGGSTQVKATCGIFVDSSDLTKAFEDTGGSCTDASSIQIVGGQNGWQACTNSPAPVSGLQPFTDPLANRTQPTVAACPSYNNAKYNGVNPPQGQYCGGLTVTGTVTMSGLYIMAGGGFTVQPPATVTGTGVTIFNTGAVSGSGGYRGITISGGSGTTVTLSAPTSGATEGILLWEDRNISWAGVGSSQTSQVTGGSSTNLTGALYFPSTKLIYSGGSSATANTDIVAYKLEINGSSTINNRTSSTSGPPAINSAAMVQ